MFISQHLYTLSRRPAHQYVFLDPSIACVQAQCEERHCQARQKGGGTYQSHWLLLSGLKSLSALQIEGFVEKDGHRLDKPTFSGTWTDQVVADMPDGSQWTLFQARSVPNGPNR